MSFDSHSQTCHSPASYTFLLFANAIPLAVFLAWHYNLPLGLVDDAYIPMVYAQNIVNGEGIVFMPGGERVEGFTNPLWMFLLTGAELFHLSLPFMAYWMGMICAAFGLFFSVSLYRAAFSCFETPTFWSQYFFPSLAAILIAADVAYASWAASGLETLGYAMLLIWLALLLIDPKDVRPAAIVQLALMILRPEGALFLPFTALFLLRARGSIAQWAQSLCYYTLIPFALFLLFRYSYFGYWLPNTFYAKHDFGGFAVYQRGLVYAQTFFIPRLILALSAVWILIEQAPIRMKALPVFAFGALQISISILEGGDHFALHRFLVPAIPFLAVLSVRIFECLLYRMLLSKARRRSGIYNFNVQAAMSVVLLLIAAGHSLQLYEHKGGDAYGFSNGARWHQSEVSWAGNWADMGRWLNGRYPPGTTIAVITAGAIPYYSQLPCIDILGLNDTHIAHQSAGDPNRKFTGHEKSDADYVLAQEPAFIQLFPLLFFSSAEFPKERLHEFLTYPAQHDLWGHPDFKSGYEYKTADTQYGVISFFERVESNPNEPPPQD